ncbi:hypothetical protein [Cerasicoccus arenae]|uniref:hypothetical protein n=1 Tax=Cerasicoccus arenae TaxID=424488 RepID=UPI00167331C3|nr:hypothetical protein [Cerasicoccus arenae]MBK1856819.1 hypothetical protein [Cerasicoccus arenae]
MVIGAICGTYYLGYYKGNGRVKSAPVRQQQVDDKQPLVAEPSDALKKAQLEITILKSSLERERALNQQLEEDLAQLLKKKSAYEWVQEQLKSGNLSKLQRLPINGDDFQANSMLVDFLGLDDRESRALAANSAHFLKEVKEWEAAHANYVEDFEGGVRYEVPQPPAKLTEDFLQAARGILNEDDFAVYEQMSQNALTQLNSSRAMEAVFVNNQGTEMFSIRMLYEEEGEYRFQHSTSTAATGYENSTFVQRWDHLLDFSE